MRRLRLAIFGESPCGECWAACCKQNGHGYAALLAGDEVRRFRAFAVTDVFVDSGGVRSVEYVLPYVEGRCQFLGDDDRCTVYEDRPAACRAFQCVNHFGSGGGRGVGEVGRHGAFLQRNPAVAELLERLAPSPSSKLSTSLM